MHDDVIKWQHFPRYWPFVRGINRLPMNSPHNGQWRGALMFSLICAWINGWVNNRAAGEFRRHRAHYDVTLMGGVWFNSVQWPYQTPLNRCRFITRNSVYSQFSFSRKMFMNLHYTLSASFSAWRIWINVNAWFELDAHVNANEFQRQGLLMGRCIIGFVYCQTIRQYWWDLAYWQLHSALYMQLWYGHDALKYAYNTSHSSFVVRRRFKMQTLFALLALSEGIHWWLVVPLTVSVIRKLDVVFVVSLNNLLNI